MLASRTVLALGFALFLNANFCRAEDKLPEEIAELHKQIAAAKGPLEVQAAREALAKLEAAKLNLSTLNSADRVRALQLEVTLRLANGDARSALARAEELLNEADADADVLRAVWQAAAAGGDAKLGDDVAKRLGAADPKVKKWVQRVRRQLKAVGREAPAQTIQPAEGDPLDLRDRRGRALLMYLWSLRGAPSAETLSAWKETTALLSELDGGEFLIVNIDKPARHDAAKALLSEHGAARKSAYPDEATIEKLVDELDAGVPPFGVVIDALGFVRTIADADSTEFAYAARCAARESLGEIERVLARRVDGTQARPPGDEPQTSDAAAPGSNPRVSQSPTEKTSNPEAAELLKQARLYRKTGKLSEAKRICQEIIEKYPGTKEAEEAEYMLPTLP